MAMKERPIIFSGPMIPPMASMDQVLDEAMKPMTAMTEEDRRAVAEAPPLMLAEWWCLLNNWDWPREGLGEPDPVPEKHDGNRRRSQIMNAICERIGVRECLREWNRKTMPGAEFDAWWDRGRRPAA